MMKKPYPKNLLIITLIILIILVVCIFTVKIYGYVQARKLCEKIKSGANIDTNVSNATTAPLFFDSIAVVTQNEGVEIPLVVACYYRNVQAVEILLENGADPNFFIDGRMSPLEAALWNGPAGRIDEKSVEIVRMLVEAGCDVNLHASEKSALISLSGIIGSDGENPAREEILLYLLDNGAQSDLNGYEYVFHNTIRAGNCKLAYKLITEYQSDVNGVGHMGQTPLILAVYYSKYNSGASATAEMIEMLLECGADKGIRDNYGKTACDYAAEYGYDHIVTLLEQ